MKTHDTGFQDSIFATLRLPDATLQFQDLSNKLALKAVANNLIEVSLNTKLSQFLCGILCFLKEPEVIKLCHLWGIEEYRFLNLAKIGEAVWHDRQVYQDLGGIDYSEQVSRIFRNDVSECYLAALLACPTPVLNTKLDTQLQVHPCWFQAFRLWLLYTALNANDAGIPSEAHLQKIATESRLVCEGPSRETKRESFRHLSFTEIPRSASEFIARLQLKANDYLSSAARNPSGQYAADFTRLVKNDFAALFNHQFKPLPITEGKDYGTYRSTPESKATTPATDEDGNSTTDRDFKDLEELVQEKSAGIEGVRSTRSNPESTPESQEQASGQVLLLSREDGLMLPWSWHRLSDTERSDFFNLFSNLKTSGRFTANLAAAIASVAILTGKSGRQVEDIEIAEQLKDAWTLHPRQFSLSRRPPRKSNGWTPKDLKPDQIAKWLVQSTDRWTIALDVQMVSAFNRAIGKAQGAKNLGALWRATGEKHSFADWINTKFTDTAGLSRLTAPILGAITRQEIFVQSQDHVLARVVSSNPSTALPAAGAYGSYSGSTVIKAFTPVLTSVSAQITTDQLPLNWAGSQLEVLEEHLKMQLRQLEQRIADAANQEDQWVDYHNLLVTYTVLALLAMTGARPVNSAFESIAWFDFERKLVFIDDKSGGMARASRLCILTDDVIDILKNRYFPHLKNLTSALRDKLPDFSAQIDAALTGADPLNLPLFFYISNSTSFDWLEVTESGLAMKCGLNEWPIPFNFLRHRFSTRLRKLHLGVEVIEALMGHSDAGSETHGAYSLRVLCADLATARPMVEEITSELQFRVPAARSLACNSLKAPASENFFNYTRKYGNKARAQQRQHDHERTKQKALTDITRALDGRNPRTLSADDWDAIGLRMVVHESTRMPHQFGALRYDVFQQYLRTIWTKFDIKPKVKRRFLLNRDGTPTITEKSVYAPHLVQQLREQLEVACTLLEAKDLGAMVACMLAALDACLNSNIADPTVLISLACHANIIPVYFDGMAYIEHHSASEWKDGKPVRRFPVTLRCIKHLLTGLTEQKARHKLAQCPASLGALPDLLALPPNVEFGILLRKIASLAAESNCYYFSGLQAAVLDGRIHLSALPRHDWLRAQKLAVPILSDQASEVQAVTATDEYLLTSTSAKFGNVSDPKSVDKTQACRRLFRGIRKVIDSVLPTSQKCSDIQALLDQSIFKHGDLAYALGEWGAHNLVRPANTKTQKLKKSSAATYFNDLAGRVASVASGQQLSDCDDDELLEVYRTILQPPEAMPLSNKQVDSIGRRRITEEMGTPAPEGIQDAGPQSVDASVIQQLLDFHEWAAAKYGLEDPDFSELGEFEFAPVGRPGIVLKSEYLWCLRQLTASETLQTVSHDNHCAAMVMILAYRFGLRSREAMGLYRRDWVTAAEALVVLVHPNYLRGLKNLQSKRQIPKTEPFTPLEQKIAVEALRRWDAREGVNQNTPLLADLNQKNFKYFCISIRSKLLRLLKSATGNTRSTVHHLRHSFASRTLASVVGRQCELGADTFESSVRSRNLRKLLLSHDQIDRRAVWAVCRLMGHSSPATLLKAYFHGQLLPVPATNHSSLLSEIELNDSHLVNLDQIEFCVDYLPPASVSVNATDDKLTQVQTLESRVNYLRLRAIGFPMYRAAHTVGMPILKAHHFEQYVSLAAANIVPAHKGEMQMKSVEHFVRKIAVSRWRPLLALTMTKDGEPIFLLGNRDIASPNTVGSHRHILLFKDEHLHAFAQFCNALELGKKDIKLLRTLQMDQSMISLHENLGLAVYSRNHATDKTSAARISHVTAAISEDSNQRVKFLERWGAFCEPGKKFSDNFELIMLWICWSSRAFLTDPHF